MDLRDIVLKRTAGRAHQFPQFDLAPLVTDGLSARDAGLAQAIDQAVARRWITLRALIESRIDRPWESMHATVQAAMLVALAQLMLLERVPDYAAINASVDWTRHKVSRKAGGFVNAILRRLSETRGEVCQVDAPVTTAVALPRDGILLEDGRVRRLTADVFAEDETDRLSQQTSVPRTLIDRWARHFDRAEAERIALHAVCHAPILLTEVTDADLPAPSDSTDETTAPIFLPHDDSQFRVFNGTHDQLLALLKHNPKARVQDPASAAPVRALQTAAGFDPSIIIDVCAGRGTKTRQLAQQFPNATVIASDTDHRRLEALRSVIQPGERIEIVKPEHLINHAGRADVLIADVPCSNTGVLARRPEARYRLNAKSLEGLVDLQRQILADHLNLLSPHGRILYATCSLEPEENEHQARWLTEWHNYRITTEKRLTPRTVPGDPASGYCDGGYFAVLEPGD